tara:strand:- start:1229 stop:1459 length:231 start_codon:yes stop_codon:yes gene_type:complete
MILGNWIELKFGSQKRLNDSLLLGRDSVNRWYNHDPKKLFMYVPQLARFSDTPVDEVIRMIEDRVKDVKAGRNEPR